MATIVYFTKHTQAGPSSRYRSYKYHAFLGKHGYAVTSHSLFPAGYLPAFYKKHKKPYLLVALGYARRFLQLLFLKKYDIIYIEYELFPFLPFWVEKLFLKNKKNVVLDYDDAVFHNYDKSNNVWVKKYCGDKIFKLVALANTVITGSPYLTHTLQLYNKKIQEIPTSVNLNTYLKTAAAFTTTNTFRIGWIGSKTTSKNVLLVKEALQQLQKQHAVTLVLIGFDELLVNELQDINYEQHAWSEATEIAVMKTFDVGIMPLLDTDFNNGKCGFKLIQYMACGLPTISTPLEANIKINHSGNNLHATTTGEWLVCFVKILQNKQYYKTVVGKQNISIVKDFYDADINAEKFLNLFEEVLKTS